MGISLLKHSHYRHIVYHYNAECFKMLANVAPEPEQRKRPFTQVPYFGFFSGLQGEIYELVLFYKRY